MADNTATAGKTSAEEGKNQNPPAGDSGRTFTQEEVNAMLAKERRDTQAKYPFRSSGILTGSQTSCTRTRMRICFGAVAF